MNVEEHKMDTGIAILLGEIKGQMNALINSTNNAAMKIDALATRVSALEADHQRREGATNLVTMFVKSPAVAWLAAAAAAAWSFFSGRVG